MVEIRVRFPMGPLTFIMKMKIRGYDKKYPVYFAREKRLLSKLGRLEIHHVGSTAVRGLSGKGWIDIMMILKNPKQKEEVTEKLKRLGYEKANTQRKERIFLSKNAGKMRYNLHLYLKKSKKALDKINFRDYLRKSRLEMRNYENFKKGAYEESKGDRIKYKKLKESYFRKMMKVIR